MTDYSLPADNGSDVENDLSRLTGIRDAYTLANTAEQGSETDNLMITNFFTTLAEIALAIASRNLLDEQKGEQ